MAQRRTRSFSGVVQPVTSVLHRFAFVLLIVAAFALMLVGKADIVLVNRAKVALVDAVTPILEALSKPAATVSSTLQDMREVRDMRAENVRLKSENEKLGKWRHLALRLQAENRSLQRLTKFVPPPSADFVSARVIADAGGAFVRSVLVNAGANNGVRLGLPAMAGEGLAGTVVEVGNQYARVLLLTDLNSQIPVVIESTRDPAVAAGDNTRRMKLLYLPQNAEIAVGNRVVTSGHGGVLPPGLPVGVVTAVSKASVTVEPFVDWNRLEYLRMLDYQLKGVATSDADGPPVYSVLGREDESNWDWTNPLAPSATKK